MMFFELRRQDLKATPWASPRGPRYTSFCMRHLHNKKTPHTYVYGVFFVELRRQDLNLRRPTSKHGRLLSLPLVSRHTPCFFAFGCSLHLPLAAVTPKAPGTRRSQSQNKKTPCLCMMFFELRRQDLKATPWASPRGPRYTSFCMRHLHNKKTPHTYVYGVFF